MAESNSTTASTSSAAPSSSGSSFSGQSSSGTATTSSGRRDRTSGRSGLSFMRDPIATVLAERRRMVVTDGGTSSSSAGRRDAVSYVVSVLRANSNEHCDSLPELDVAAMKHVAYTLDALIGYLRCCDITFAPGGNSSSGSSNVASTHPIHSGAPHSLLSIDTNNSNDSNSNAASSYGGFDEGDDEMSVDDVPPTNFIQPPQPPSGSNRDGVLDAHSLAAAVSKARKHRFFLVSSNIYIFLSLIINKEFFF